MTNSAAPALAVPMPAARETWRSPGISLTLSLAPADLAVLDPKGTGSIELFGVTFVAESVPNKGGK